MEVKTVNGDSYTFTGEVVQDVKKYLKSGRNFPLGWVAGQNGAVNFNHVVSIEFK